MEMKDQKGIYMLNRGVARLAVAGLAAASCLTLTSAPAQAATGTPSVVASKHVPNDCPRSGRLQWWMTKVTTGTCTSLGNGKLYFAMSQIQEKAKRQKLRVVYDKRGGSPAKVALGYKQANKMHWTNATTVKKGQAVAFVWRGQQDKFQPSRGYLKMYTSSGTKTYETPLFKCDGPNGCPVLGT